jgi:predicted amidohydrolase YtcJ
VCEITHRGWYNYAACGARETLMKQNDCMAKISFWVGLALCSSQIWAQTADTVLVNGKVVTVDGQNTVREAVAIRDGRIAAVGRSADIRKMAGPKTKVIDLQGRTVIPGLIDSHMHGIRAASTFATEVNWIGASSIIEALGRLSDAARTKKPGAWLIVAGGWTPQQFKENRRPTQAEITAAAPNNPTYIQLGYGWAVLSPLALKTLNINSDSDIPQGGKLERDANGQSTGAISGGQGAIIALFDKLPLPTYAEQVEGTKKFFRELNRLGLTGFVDIGGNNVFPESYQAITQVWREKQMTVRVAYSICGFTPGKEFEEYKSYAALLPMGFGDDMLRFNGVGERITWAMNNNEKPTEEQKAKYYEIIKWAAERGMALTMHSNNDAAANEILALFERLNKEVPITNLRWSLAHLNDTSPAILRRMKALGMGWTMQDEMYFGGEEYVRRRGAEAARRVPPVMTAKEIGVPVGAGTDAHRVASYNPFTALQWMLDGKTAGGVALRGPEETPSRAEALRLYTLGSAWFSRDEDQRGSIEVGKLADLAVLSKDYLTVPVDQVGGIESLLTMVGGKAVYAAGPLKQWERQ